MHSSTRAERLVINYPTPPINDPSLVIFWTPKRGIWGVGLFAHVKFFLVILIELSPSKPKGSQKVMEAKSKGYTLTPPKMTPARAMIVNVYQQTVIEQVFFSPKNPRVFF